MMTRMKVGFRAVVFAVVAVAAMNGEVKADAVADFYSGKQVTLLVGYGPGGGFDTRARLIAKFMGRHIPGNPGIIVQNMPGAGSKRLANHLYKVAPKDGTVFGVINEAMATNPLFGVEGTQFDALKFTWLGSLVKDPSICFAMQGSGIKTMDDLTTREFIVGATGTGSTSYILPTTMNQFLGAKIKIIVGYKGTSEITLAAERGEVHGMCGLTWQNLNALKPDWVPDGKATVIGQMGQAKDPALPDVPLMLDLVKDKDDRATWKLLFANREMGNPYVAPPGLPADRKQALRRAFDATVRDPEFIAEAAKSGMALSPNTGEEIDALLKQTYVASAQVVDMAIEVLSSQ